MKLAYLLYALLMLSGLFSCVANEKNRDAGHPCRSGEQP